MMTILDDPQTIYQEEKRVKNFCFLCQPAKKTILYESENFRITIDPFPVAPGHILISSKEHYGCAGELGDKLRELSGIKEAVRTYFEEHVGGCIFYEHGRAGGCAFISTGDILCEHFHLHCIPQDICIASSINSKLPYRLLGNYMELEPHFFETAHYLYFENADKEMFFYPVSSHDAIEPHYLRSLVAKALGQPALADWRVYDNYQIFEESYHLVVSMRLNL